VDAPLPDTPSKAHRSDHSTLPTFLSDPPAGTNDEIGRPVAATNQSGRSAVQRDESPAGWGRHPLPADSAAAQDEANGQPRRLPRR